MSEVEQAAEVDVTELDVKQVDSENLEQLKLDVQDIHPAAREEGTDVVISGSDDVTLKSVASGQEPTDSAPQLKAVIEAAIYITAEPLSAEQIASAIEHPIEQVKQILAQLVGEYAAPDRGLSVRELAGGYMMATKAEHHESVRQFVQNLQPPFKLSLAALETLAVVAYRQPITAPEIMEVRGVQGAGVLKTLLDRKLIAAGGRKNVIGKPILYRTTREFLVQFGLSSLAELPTLKEFEELGRLALTEGEEIVMENQTANYSFDEPASATDGNASEPGETRPNETDESRPADLVNPEAVSYGDPEGKATEVEDSQGFGK